MVEAAIVLPLLILIVLSLILLTMYFYSVLGMQTAVHHRLNLKDCDSKGVFQIISQSERLENQMGGATKIILKKDFKARCYHIKPVSVIRFGNKLKGTEKWME